MVIMRVKQQDGSVVNIPIGKGADGEDGLSAYEIWLQQGNTGSEEDFLESLKGAKGKNGTSVTVVSVTESTEDRGENVVTFSDGQTLTVQNGTSGDSGVYVGSGDMPEGCNVQIDPDGSATDLTGATFIPSISSDGVLSWTNDKGLENPSPIKVKGDDGHTPQKGTDYWTSADKSEMTAQVQAVCVAKNQGTANVGKILVVGTDGNLTLTNMPEGGASGDVTGVLDESNNILLSGNLVDGTYTLKYEMEDGSYATVGTLEVGAIPEPEPIKNLAEPTSADWQEGYRLSISSGTTSELAGHTVTNYIPCKVGDVLRVKGLAISNTDTGSGGSSSPKIIWFDENKAKIIGIYGTIASGSAQCYGAQVSVDNDISTYTVAIANDGQQKAASNTAFIRLDGLLINGYSKEDVIITINQEIE